MSKINYFWFRRDLRLNDNHGLYEALRAGLPVRCVFIFDTTILKHLPSNDLRVQFIFIEIQRLKKELKGLTSDFQSCNSDLEIWYGDPISLWEQRLQMGDINAIFCNRDYEPAAIVRDQKVHNLALSMGVNFLNFKDQCIFEAAEVTKDDGKPYTVFTPYSKKWRFELQKQCLIDNQGNWHYQHSYPSETLLNNLEKADSIHSNHNSLDNPDINLERMGFQQVDFNYPAKTVSQALIQSYSEKRDYPAIQGTSRLGIHFRFGTLSIREKLKKALLLNQTFVNELIWRDFYMQILWHFPHVEKKSFKPAYDLINWQNNEDDFQKWKDGQTGYPIVDAGIRELNQTGFMHNRVRMITASFLTKHLLIDWRWGEAYFAEKLLDFELASNNGGWQWAAGSGVDAAPYFRIFNPTAQMEKFDKQGIYIKKWIPELLKGTYPKPMIDHSFARNRCLETYQSALKKEG